MKEVLIITDKMEQAVLDVYDWIIYFGGRCSLIDYKGFINQYNINKTLTNENAEYIVQRKSKLDKISSIWFRREMKTKSEYSTMDFLDKNVEGIFRQNINNEVVSLKRILWSNDRNIIRFLSNYESIFIDKFKVLGIAQRIGIKIPETIITNNKQILIDFIKKHKQVISKATHENLSFQYYNKAFMQYVNYFTLENQQRC